MDDEDAAAPAEDAAAPAEDRRPDRSTELGTDLQRTRDRSEELIRRARELQDRGAQLRQRMIRDAGAIAETEERVAVVEDQVAASHSAAAEGAVERARRARGVAEHERREQERWSAD